MVALNYQANDQAMALQHGFFSDNGDAATYSNPPVFSLRMVRSIRKVDCIPKANNSMFVSSALSISRKKPTQSTIRISPILTSECLSSELKMTIPNIGPHLYATMGWIQCGITGFERRSRVPSYVWFCSKFEMKIDSADRPFSDKPVYRSIACKVAIDILNWKARTATSFMAHCSFTWPLRMSNFSLRCSSILSDGVSWNYSQFDILISPIRFGKDFSSLDCLTSFFKIIYWNITDREYIRWLIIDFCLNQSLLEWGYFECHCRSVLAVDPYRTKFDSFINQRFFWLEVFVGETNHQSRQHRHRSTSWIRKCPPRMMLPRCRFKNSSLVWNCKD